MDCFARNDGMFQTSAQMPFKTLYAVKLSSTSRSMATRSPTSEARMSIDITDIPEGFEPHFRKSPLTDPWEPLFWMRI